MITENPHKFKIFVDFDGTITKKDVGENMFLTFGDPDKAREIVQRWISEEINSKETWIQLCETIPSLDMQKFDEFINSMEVDETFLDFVNYCNENGHEIFVLSDGLDYYINKILKRYGLENLTLYSNIAEFRNGRIYPVFPYTDEECDRCANCKRNHIINNSADDDITIYIGDGFSDTCPAQFTDFIFAKNSLLKYCEKNRISYYPFENFNEIILRIEELSKRRRIRKRRQAELNRRAVYLQG